MDGLNEDLHSLVMIFSNESAKTQVTSGKQPEPL